jgi:hypothetical protein
MLATTTLVFYSLLLLLIGVFTVQQQLQQQLQQLFDKDDPANVAFIQWTSILADRQALNGVFYPSCNDAAAAGSGCGPDPAVPLDSVLLPGGGGSMPYPTGA